MNPGMTGSGPVRAPLAQDFFNRRENRMNEEDMDGMLFIK
jgi:hypothetical protein